MAALLLDDSRTSSHPDETRQTGGHVRIVAMTVCAMNGDGERRLAAGMDGYLSKPIDQKMLYAVVDRESIVGKAPRAAVAMLDCPARMAAIKAAVDLLDTLRRFGAATFDGRTTCAP